MASALEATLLPRRAPLALGAVESPLLPVPIQQQKLGTEITSRLLTCSRDQHQQQNMCSKVSDCVAPFSTQPQPPQLHMGLSAVSQFLSKWASTWMMRSA